MNPPPDPLVRSAVSAGRGPSGPHPDAEVLGLFADRALADDERRAVEAHVASCVRCQAIVSEVAAGLPAHEDGAAGASGLVGWLTGWRWLMPAASLAAVALLAVWVTRPAPHERSASEVASPSAIPDAAITTSPSRAAGPESVGAAPPTSPPDRRAALDAAPPAASRSAASPSGRPAAPPARGAAQAPGQGVAATPQSQEPASLVAGARPAGAGGAGEPVPSTGGAMSALGPETTATTRAREHADTALADAAARPVPRPAAAPPPAPAPQLAGATANEARAEKSTAAGAVAPAPFEAGAPAAAAPASPMAGRGLTADRERRSPGWRVTDGRVERSTDEGRTWRMAATPAGLRVVAVAGLSDRIAWAVTAEAVLRTLDGRSWERLSAPGGAPFRAVAATDADHATVTTAAGGRYATADGGRTWRRLP